MSPAITPPALQEAAKKSTSTWQADLQALFHHAKDRFPDVLWELELDDDGEKGRTGEEVWGHKAIVYARAPPSFQARYFSFRPAPLSSPLPYSSSPTGTIPAQSSLSLSIGLDIPGVSRSPSPYRVASPTPSTTPGALLRLKTSINPILFSNELEYLYTGKGFGEAFEFLFDTSESREEGDAEENRIDKLRKDLVFMWRSRLYSDVRIALTGNFSSTNHDDATAIFSSHRFILVSRSPYFHTALLSWGVAARSADPNTINLPSPPFTPASLHFTLGYIYTGTLIFSHRTYDLDTAFHIMRSATYLAIDSLYDEIQARIVQEMMHGLFHAFLEFTEYERITGGKWGTGGCRCRQCARRAPRVLEFSISDDVKNMHLERGARRALVGLFGEGWATSEFSGLPQRTKDSLLKGLGKRTVPVNVFALLFAAQHAMKKLTTIIDAWADSSREMILAARKNIDDVLCAQAEECFEQPEWLEILEADGIRFEDTDKTECVMEAVKRGVNEKNAPMVYQVLVSSILLRPHATETGATMVSSTSQIRVKVEDTRMDIIRWMRKRWTAIRQEGGFDLLEGWAIKEISYEIEVPVEELFSSNISSPPKGSSAKAGNKPVVGKADTESDTLSMHSLRTSVLNRNITKRNMTPIQRDQPLASGASSIRSVARSTISTPGIGRRPQPPLGPRPDSKLTPSLPSGVTSPTHSCITEDDTTDPDAASSILPPPSTKVTLTRPNVLKAPTTTITPRRSVISTRTTSSITDRPKSSASSFMSVRSQASTLRRVPAPAGASLSRPASSVSRPVSNATTTTENSTFKTARSERSVPRSRRTSSASVTSNVSVKTSGLSTPKVPQSRQSAASTASSTAKTKRPPVPPIEPSKRNTNRMASNASTRSSIASTSSSIAQKSTITRKSVASDNHAPKANGHATPGAAAAKDKGKSKAVPVVSQNSKRPRTTSSSSTLNGKLKRKSSSDTITKLAVTPENPPQSQLKDQLPSSPRGSTLEIGIPCIISSKRKRFKAFARYIGEVEGELGPWVGVEVPVGETWAGDKLDGRQWNDGTWGGIRYFEIGGFGSEWDYGDDRAARRRRIDQNLSKKGGGLKREGDQLSVRRPKRFRSASPTASDLSGSESRGLFVRPQQVLYVVDAVGTDL